MSERKTVAVDLDGVLLEYDGWKGHTHLGEPIPGAVEFTKELRKLGAYILIYTTRCSENNHPNAEEFQESLRLVREALDRYGFQYDEIYTGVGKPLFVACVDDRNVACRPQEDPLDYKRALTGVRLLMQTAK